MILSTSRHFLCLRCPPPHLLIPFRTSQHTQKIIGQLVCQKVSRLKLATFIPSLKTKWGEYEQLNFSSYSQTSFFKLTVKFYQSLGQDLPNIKMLSHRRQQIPVRIPSRKKLRQVNQRGGHIFKLVWSNSTKTTILTFLRQPRMVVQFELTSPLI